MSVVRARSGGQPGLSTTVVRGILSSTLASARRRGDRATVFLGFYYDVAVPARRGGRGAFSATTSTVHGFAGPGRAVEKASRARVSAWPGGA
jgi:hypothetical protein